MFVFRFSGAGADLPFLSSSSNSAPLGSVSPKATVVVTYKERRVPESGDGQNVLKVG